MKTRCENNVGFCNGCVRSLQQGLYVCCAHPYVLPPLPSRRGVHVDDVASSLHTLSPPCLSTPLVQTCRSVDTPAGCENSTTRSQPRAGWPLACEVIRSDHARSPACGWPWVVVVWCWVVVRKAAAAAAGSRQQAAPPTTTCPQRPPHRLTLVLLTSRSPPSHTHFRRWGEGG